MADASLDWRLLERRTLVETDRLRLTENSYDLPDGQRKDGYHLVHERDGALVVAITPEREMLLVRQWRPAIERETLELPAGSLEPGESDALERAKAELREETGYEAERWIRLGTFDPAPNRLSTRHHCFLALGARKRTGQDLDDSEFVKTERVPFEEVERLIQEGSFSVAACVAAYLLARMRLGGWR